MLRVGVIAMAEKAGEAGRGLRRRAESLLSIYEDLIGVTQVKESHNQLLQAESIFITSQLERRKAQESLAAVGVKVRAIRASLDRTPRGEENYLDLVKEEIELVREERSAREIFEREEKAERDHFTRLSNALRTSYEKERSQSEKTKPLFLLVSVVGGLVGASISALSSQSKIKQLKSLILDTNSANSSATLETLRQCETLLQQIREENENIIHGISSSSSSSSDAGPPHPPADTQPLNQSLKSTPSQLQYHLQSASLIVILALVLYQTINR